MDAAPKRSLEVQHAISERNDSRWPVEPCETLLFPRLVDTIHSEFFGLPFDKSFENFIEAIGSLLVVNQPSSHQQPHEARLIEMMIGC